MIYKCRSDLLLLQMSCMVEELAKSTCQADNLVCICTSQQLDTAIGACLARDCTVVESLRKLQLCSRSSTN